MLGHEIEFKTPQIFEKPSEKETSKEFRPENFGTNESAAENLSTSETGQLTANLGSEVAGESAASVEHSSEYLNQLHLLEEIINTGKMNVADIEIGNKKGQMPASAAAKAILELKD